MSTIEKLIKDRARELGFSGCGIIEAGPIEEFTHCLEERVHSYPESKSLYEPLRPFAFPLERAAWARSIVVCTVPFNHYRIPEGLDRHFGRIYLCDVRVAGTPEYEKIAAMESFLRQQGLQAFGGMIAARWAAQKAGLGGFGKNNFLYTEQDGSWVWIQTWLVDAKLECDAPARPEPVCPPGCRRCIDACPTRALAGPFSMDRGRCIAQLSYYSEELPPEPLRKAMGGWLYGCDVCQSVCPLNKNKWRNQDEYPGLSGLSSHLQPENLLALREDFLASTLQPRFWYIPQDKLWLWRCNAIRAMANSRDSRHLEAVGKARSDRDGRVREMADWAFERLREAGIS